MYSVALSFLSKKQLELRRHFERAGRRQKRAQARERTCFTLGSLHSLAEAANFQPWIFQGAGQRLHPLWSSLPASAFWARSRAQSVSRLLGRLFFVVFHLGIDGPD